MVTNIAESEQQHMDAVKNLLDQYGINDPVGDDVEGVFYNGILQNLNLYSFLISAGASETLTEQEALWVGATIIDMDILDIQEMLAKTDKSDLVFVYENLMKGSRNHLRSFCGLLETSGESYEAQYLSQGDVNDILNTAKETDQK